MNIILTGYRGSGKTTIGKALAKRLQREFIDTDDLIEAKEGMTIKSLFDKRGWQYFRKVEKKVIRGLTKKDNTVIAVGGGSFMYKENLCLKENARVVLLIAPFEVLSERIKNDPDRPPLTEGQASTEEIREVWGRRKERYYGLADAVVDTGNGDADRIVREIIQKLNIEHNEN